MTEPSPVQDAPALRLRVRVIGSDPEYWYRNRIGEIFEVVEAFCDLLWVMDGDNRVWLSRQDCELIAELSPADRTPLSERERLLLDAVDALLTYREQNTLNWQLEKADDYFRFVRRAREGYPAGERK